MKPWKNKNDEIKQSAWRNCNCNDYGNRICHANHYEVYFQNKTQIRVVQIIRNIITYLYYHVTS